MFIIIFEKLYGHVWECKVHFDPFQHCWTFLLAEWVLLCLGVIWTLEYWLELSNAILDDMGSHKNKCRLILIQIRYKVNMNGHIIVVFCLNSSDLNCKIESFLIRLNIINDPTVASHPFFLLLAIENLIKVSVISFYDFEFYSVLVADPFNNSLQHFFRFLVNMPCHGEYWGLIDGVCGHVVEVKLVHGS